jgi:CheY-like chemotaxis protein
LQPKVTDLDAIIADAEIMLRRLIGEDIEMAVNLGANPGRVKADQTQLVQVILNLAVNARDAMPRGGTLTIETATVDIDEDYSVNSEDTPKPGRYVVLRVSDTGTGMSKDTQASIFEPFFTTKTTKGSGLGLATVYGVVRQSDGYISVHSELGYGTAFEILFPLVRETFDSPSSEALARIPGGNETILLVEDSNEVRALIRQFLEGSGYKVLTAKDSAEALGISTAYQDTIHLVLSDVVMPRISGPELVGHLFANRPAMKVLLMSGYTNDRVRREMVGKDDFNLIEKPFTQLALGSKLREVLDGATTRAGQVR